HTTQKDTLVPYTTLFRSKREVNEKDTPDAGDFEVYASPAEIERYRSYVEENSDIEKEYGSMMLPFKPLAQDKVDEMSEEMNENMMKEIEFIYDFGTDETREKLKEMGFNK